MTIKPTSWIYIAELDISIRWIQRDYYQDILRGNWSLCRDLPIIARIPTNGTWTDDTDVYREANRYLKSNYENWYARKGPLTFPVWQPHATPAVPASRTPERVTGRLLRSTDFVQR